MSFFSRLSDIVSCRLDDLLADAHDAGTALGRMISEIEEGLAGARRSVQSAGAAEQRLQTELVERQGQAAFWGKNAREELAAGRENSARQSLLRKRETEDLAAGIQQQLAAATSTREHLSTTLRAIEARLAEAQRRQREFRESDTLLAAPKRAEAPSSGTTSTAAVDRTRAAEIDAELEALRREMDQSR